MSYQTIKKLLVERLPKLRELTMGCEIEHAGLGKLKFIAEKYCQKKEHDIEYGCNNVDYCNNLACLDSDNRVIYGNTWTPYEILGHDPSHSDILKVLGEDWAMQSGGQLWKYEKTDTGGGWTFVSPTWEEYPCLPDNISDLSLPEYEKTREKLISLLK